MAEYIVISEENKPMGMGKYDEKEPEVLWDGDTVKKFKNYQQAYRAIKRSQKFAEKCNFNWHTDKYRIMRLI